jgi:hypothetical protein
VAGAKLAFERIAVDRPTQVGDANAAADYGPGHTESGGGNLSTRRSGKEIFSASEKILDDVIEAREFVIGITVNEE